MAFRFAPAPFVIVGTPDVNSIVITPQGIITNGPEIDFSHANAFGVQDATAQLGMSGLTFYMQGPTLNADAGAFPPPELLLSKTGTGKFPIVDLLGDKLRGILYNVGTGLGNANGVIPVIQNDGNFASGQAGKWMFQFNFYGAFACPVGLFNVTMNRSFPTGELGAWSWVSQSGAANILYSGAFPGGTRNLLQLNNVGAAGNYSFALFTVVSYT